MTGGSWWGGLLSLTVFLPITLFTAIPIRSHPGSPYTLGMALMGFAPWIGVPGFIIAIANGSAVWAIVFAYLLVGQWVVGRELIARGYMGGVQASWEPSRGDAMDPALTTLFDSLAEGQRQLDSEVRGWPHLNEYDQPAACVSVQVWEAGSWVAGSIEASMSPAMAMFGEPIAPNLAVIVRTPTRERRHIAETLCPELAAIEASATGISVYELRFRPRTEEDAAKSEDAAIVVAGEAGGVLDFLATQLADRLGLYLSHHPDFPRITPPTAELPDAEPPSDPRSYRVKLPQRWRAA